MATVFKLGSQTVLIGRPVECLDATGDRPLCQGVRECGTSVHDRCTCGFRRSAEVRHYGAVLPAANQRMGLLSV